MITSFAVCECCGDKVQGTQHPTSWLSVAIQGEPTHYVCSRACLVDQFGSDALHRRAGGNSGLTDLDIQILKHLALGRTNAETGLQVNRTERSIKNRLEGIYDRLGARSRLQVVLIAHARGLVNLSVSAREFAQGKSE